LKWQEALGSRRLWAAGGSGLKWQEAVGRLLGRRL